MSVSSRTRWPGTSRPLLHADPIGLRSNGHAGLARRASLATAKQADDTTGLTPLLAETTQANAAIEHRGAGRPLGTAARRNAHGDVGNLGRPDAGRPNLAHIGWMGGITIIGWDTQVDVLASRSAQPDLTGTNSVTTIGKEAPTVFEAKGLAPAKGSGTDRRDAAGVRPSRQSDLTGAVDRNGPVRDAAHLCRAIAQISTDHGALGAWPTGLLRDQIRRVARVTMRTPHIGKQPGVTTDKCVTTRKAPISRRTRLRGSTAGHERCGYNQQPCKRQANTQAPCAPRFHNMCSVRSRSRLTAHSAPHMEQTS